MISLTESFIRSCSLILVCKSSYHDICLLRIVHILTIHYDIIFFDNSYCSILILILLCLLSRHIWSSIVLLCLNYISTLHLWIFYFYLRIVKNVVIIVNVLYYFYWLLLTILLGFRGTISAIMSSMESRITAWDSLSLAVFRIKVVSSCGRLMSSVSNMLTRIRSVLWLTFIRWLASIIGPFTGKLTLLLLIIL